MSIQLGGERRSPNSPEMLEIAERQQQAWRLRLAGQTYAQIAAELGYADASGAYRAIQQARRSNIIEPNRELRELEIARLDELLSAVWERAMTGDEGAIDRVLKIQQRRASLLGLDAAPKLPEKDLDGLIEQELARIAGATEAAENEAGEVKIDA